MNKNLIPCQISGHNEIISFMCLEKSCNELRHGCNQCIENNFHFDHQVHIKQVSGLLNFLSDSFHQFDKLINKLNNINRIINQVFDELKQSIQMFETMKSQGLEKTNIQQINKVISNLMKFDTENQKQIHFATQKTETLIQSLIEFLKNSNIFRDCSKISEVHNLINQTNPEANKKHLKFEPTKSIKEIDYCFSICLSKDSKKMIVGYMDGIIKVFEFNLGQMSLKQVLNDHQGIVGCLKQMENSNQFISGGLDNNIIIWKLNEQKLWKVLIKLNGHTNWIRCLLISNQENLIISGSNDKSIKVWKNDIRWQCAQTIIEHKSEIMSLSLNQSQTYLISCALYDDEVIVTQQQYYQEWIIIQKIVQKGQRLCYINDNVFIVLPYLSKIMFIFELNNTNNLFAKTIEPSVNNGNSCHCFFQPQIRKADFNYQNWIKCQLIKINQKFEFSLEYSIYLGSGCVFGRSTNDGQFMITWDDLKKQFQIFILNDN